MGYRTQKKLVHTHHSTTVAHQIMYFRQKSNRVCVTLFKTYLRELMCSLSSLPRRSLLSFCNGCGHCRVFPGCAGGAQPPRQLRGVFSALPEMTSASMSRSNQACSIVLHIYMRAFSLPPSIATMALSPFSPLSCLNTCLSSTTCGSIRFHS